MQHIIIEAKEVHVLALTLIMGILYYSSKYICEKIIPEVFCRLGRC